MKKRLLILVPVAVILAITLALVLVNNHQTPVWRDKLDQYLIYLRTTGQASYRVLAFSPANQPGNFTSAMSAESFSDSVIFQATTNMNAQYSAGLQPMPYPPEQVMCVLLGNSGQTQLVYVALHNSLYNADWIVHISSDPWNSSALHASLTTLECSLSE